MPHAPRTILFHHPLPIEPEPLGGSQIRPARMVEAFREIGFEVEVIAGYSNERARAIARVLEQLRRGRRFAFLYAETSTTPNALNDPDHFPRRPALDAAFLRNVRAHGIPIGMFYRDAYWRFRVFRESVALPKRILMLPLYHLDWAVYRRYVHHLFLPCAAMAAALPGGWPHEQVSELPPGTDVVDPPGVPPLSPWDAGGGGSLKIVYVGTARGPLYDVEPLVSAVARVPRAALTIVCPPGELPPRPFAPADRIRVVHARGRDLHGYYAEADVAALVFRSHPYRRFAMPLKLFEALGHGVPILASGGTSAGSFVAETGVGITVKNDDLESCLTHLADSPERLQETRSRARVVRHEHTWQRRAEQVARILASSVRSSSLADRSNDGRV